VIAIGRLLRRALCPVLVGSAVLAAPQVAAQSSTTTGPVVILDRDEIVPGDRVGLSIDGFDAVNVTISVCGNEARRGSVDCNMFASEGLRLDTDGTSTIAQIPIAAPPAPCPCVIRVSSRTNDEIAVAPIVLTGHPVAPVTEGSTLSNLLAVSITARAAPEGLLARGKASLGGAATYEVTVTVKNRSTVTLRQVSLAGSAGRSDDDLAVLVLDDPGVIAAGQTWQQVVDVEVPAPSLGSIEWRLAASGAGATVTATDVTRQRPLLLMGMVMLLVLDLGVLAIRRTVRRRAGREAAAAGA